MKTQNLKPRNIDRFMLMYCLLRAFDGFTRLKIYNEILSSRKCGRNLNTKSELEKLFDLTIPEFIDNSDTLSNECIVCYERTEKWFDELERLGVNRRLTFSFINVLEYGGDFQILKARHFIYCTVMECYLQYFIGSISLSTLRFSLNSMFITQYSFKIRNMIAIIKRMELAFKLVKIKIETRQNKMLWRTTVLQ